MIDDFHPEAAKSIGAKVADLANRLEAAGPDSVEPFLGPMPHVSAALGAQDIIRFESTSEVDAAGQETGRFGPVGNEFRGLRGEAYSTFASLAESIATNRALKKAVALSTVKKLLFDLILSDMVQDGSETARAIVEECRRLVREYTVAVPIAELALEEPQQIGNVEIRSVSAGMLDEWIASLELKGPEAGKILSVLQAKWRPRYQGRAAAFITVVADSVRAQELALLETERALAALRVFSPGSLHPRAQTVCVPMGQQAIQTQYLFAFEGPRCLGEQSKIIAAGAPVWQVRAADMRAMWAAGLEHLSDIVEEPDASDLTSAILESLLVYSRAALTSDTSEKLVHTFVGLESLLLRNESEPIQTSLAERVAFLVGRSPDQRMAIARDVKDAYSLRSSFIHHNARLVDFETVGRFLAAAYHAFLNVARLRSQYLNRNALVTAIELRKYA